MGHFSDIRVSSVSDLERPWSSCHSEAAPTSFKTPDHPNKCCSCGCRCGFSEGKCRSFGGRWWWRLALYRCAQTLYTSSSSQGIKSFDRCFNCSSSSCVSTPSKAESYIWQGRPTFCGFFRRYPFFLLPHAYMFDSTLCCALVGARFYAAMVVPPSSLPATISVCLPPLKGPIVNCCCIGISRFRRIIQCISSF